MAISETDIAIAELTDGSSLRQLPLQFSGSTAEYFRIWIVNVLLSIVTLGVYSAWAKVRNKRYFYGNTLLDGSSFEYHGKPGQILRGRVIAVTLLLLVAVLSAISPPLAGLLPVLLFILAPLLIRQGLRFNLAMSSYRGIRFSFHGSRGGAFSAYLWWPVLASVTAYLLWPHAHRKASEYRVSHMHFGQSAFLPRLRSAAFYRAYTLTIISVIGLAVLLMAVAGFSLDWPPLLARLEQGEAQMTFLIQMVVLLLFSVASVFSRGMLNAMTNNHIYSSTTLGDAVAFRSRLNPLRLGWIYLSNLALIVLSAGLLIPWARIRLMRYRIAHTSVFSRKGLDHFVAAEREQQSALGEELVDAFDMELGTL